MKGKIHCELLLIIVGMWVIFGLIDHAIIMPIFNNQLLHCLLISTAFGIINYFLMLGYYKKYLRLESTNQILRNSMDLDKLTGLLNRCAFEKHISEMNESALYSIIFADIDNFRNFNNSYGHDIGDMVLQKVSEMIKITVRSGDRVYRYGGEEIVVLLMDCDKENTKKISEKIRLNVINMDNTPFPNITLSLGVSTYPDDGDDIRQIIKESDNALLNAKNQGKNRTYSHQ